MLTKEEQDLMDSYTKKELAQKIHRLQYNYESIHDNWNLLKKEFKEQKIYTESQVINIITIDIFRTLNIQNHLTSRPMSRLLDDLSKNLKENLNIEFDDNLWRHIY